MGHSMATRATTERIAELTSSPSSVPAARHLVRDDLVGRQMPRRVVEDALVVVTELMGNAVRHARPLDADGEPGNVRLRWNVVGGRVRVDVTDGGGAQRPHVERHSPAETGGRGLAIVSAVASDWGVTFADDHVTVYAVIGDQRPASG